MRSVAAALIIAAVMVGGSIFYTGKIDGVSKEMQSINKGVEQQLYSEDYETALEYIEKLKNNIEKRQTLISAMGDHEDLDNIKISIAEMEKYTEGKSRTDALAKCEALDFLLGQLSANYILTIENIL